MLADLLAYLPLVIPRVGIVLLSLCAFVLFAIWHNATHYRAAQRRRMRLLQTTSLAVSYGAAVVFGVEWTGAEGLGSLVWPASGVAVAGLLMGGTRLWPGLFLAYIAGTHIAGAHFPIPVEIALSAVTTTAAVLVAKGLRTWFPIDPRLTSVRDVVRLAIAAVGGGALAALPAVSIVVASGVLGAAAAPPLAIAWWLGNSVGTLLIAPPLLAWSYRSSWTLSLRRWLWLLTLLTATAVLSYAVFFEKSPGCCGSGWRTLCSCGWPSRSRYVASRSGY